MTVRSPLDTLDTLDALGLWPRQDRHRVTSVKVSEGDVACREQNAIPSFSKYAAFSNVKGNAAVLRKSLI